MMDIPLSLEIIITIILFVIAGVGSVMAYHIADIRSELKGLREETKEDRMKYDDVDKRLGIVETRMNICKHCPNSD